MARLTIDQLAEVVRVRQVCASGELTSLRSRARLSQGELGAALGVSAETVRGWETGRSTPPAPRALAIGEVLDRVARALDPNAPAKRRAS